MSTLNVRKIVCEGDITALEAYLENHQLSQRKGRKCLALAVKYNHLPIVKFLHEVKGIKLFDKLALKAFVSGWLNTTLYLRAQGLKIKFVSIYLERDVFQKSNLAEYLRALNMDVKAFHDFAIIHGNFTLSPDVIPNLTDISDINTNLLKASCYGRDDIMALICRHHTIGVENWSTIMTNAITDSDLKAVKFISCRQDINFSQRDIERFFTVAYQRIDTLYGCEIVWCLVAKYDPELQFTVHDDYWNEILRFQKADIVKYFCEKRKSLRLIRKNFNQDINCSGITS